MIDFLAAAVMQADLRIQNRRVEHDVHVLVDAHGEDEAAVRAVKRGQVGAAAAECNPERRSRDDQTTARVLNMVRAIARRSGVSTPRQYAPSSTTCAASWPAAASAGSTSWPKSQKPAGMRSSTAGSR